MSLAAPGTTRCVEAGILPGAVKSKSSSPAKGSTSSLRTWNTRAKPSLVSELSMRSRAILSSSAFSMMWPKLDLPSISLRTLIRSLESEADFWLTWVMPFAVLVKTVLRSMAPRCLFRSPRINNGMNSARWKMTWEGSYNCSAEPGHAPIGPTVHRRGIGRVNRPVGIRKTTANAARKGRPMRCLAHVLFALGCALPSFASAQDVPLRAGRIAWTEGAVSLYQDPAIGWDVAVENAPITSENSVWTDPGARAEVSAGATVFRLDGATQLDVAHLDYDGIDADVERGTLAVRVRHYDPTAHLVLTTEQARFALLGDGSYRLDVDPDANQARLTVFSGAAQLEGARGSVSIPAGQSVVVSGAPSPSYGFEAAASDAFDEWVATRDAQWREGPATRYVSTDMTGYEDLDAYGQWSNDADFGAVWFPTDVPADWAPYRTGHWTWVTPWGWTWVDNERWGYAPFH